MIEIDDNLNEIMEQEFKEDKIVVLQFKSEFCEPCYALEYELEELEELCENVVVLSIDCGLNEDLLEEYNVFQTPTMIVLNNQNEVLLKSTDVMLCEDIMKVIIK